MICPRCGSDNIEIDLDEDGLATFEECFACGYIQHTIEYTRRKLPGKALPKIRLHNNRRTNILSLSRKAQKL